MVNPDRMLGSILAGAIGDALGAPVEFQAMDTIRNLYGPDGITEFVHEYGGRGMITDDTQLTMFTLEGLIRGHVTGADPVEAVQQAYQRWLHTQTIPWVQARWPGAGPEPDGWLIGVPGLFALRAPGSTCLAALRGFAAGRARGTVREPLNNSKGCGAVMRAAPFALCSDDPAEVFTLSARAGALTHGHPSGYLSAGVLSVLVHQLLRGADLSDAVGRARAVLITWPGHEEQADALDAALRLASGRPTPESIADNLGGGWVGEEALAIGLCAALAARDVEDGLRLAVNHSGDTDSTGAICGNLLGARDGVAAIPARWLAEVELRTELETLTRDALAEFGPTPPRDEAWLARYP